MKTFILGDLHGDFDALNAILKTSPASTLIICGDFGFWPALGMHVQDIKNKKMFRTITVRFCDGNHEEHPLLRSLICPDRPYDAVEVADGIFYQPRGSAWTAPRGERVLFAGGAYSIDNSRREDGISWYKELELLRREDLPSSLPEVDVVISHTAPASFPIDRVRQAWHIHWSDWHDTSRDVLDMVLRESRPKRWYFGHFHEAKNGETEGCRWRCLPPCHDERPLQVKLSKIPNHVQMAIL